MANIESRLRLLFEDAGDMQITSELGLFTTVEITIPLIRPGEEIKYE
jgi:sensor histidine kinase YesM